MSIKIPVKAVERRLKYGELWVREWGDYHSPNGPTCLHGAIRYCQPIPGDAHLIHKVGDHFGWGISDNDSSGSYEEVMRRMPAEVTDSMLRSTFGPNWESIVALVRRVAVLDDEDIKELNRVVAFLELNDLRGSEKAAWSAIDSNAIANGGSCSNYNSIFSYSSILANIGLADQYVFVCRALSIMEDLVFNNFSRPRPRPFGAINRAALALTTRDLVGSYGYEQRHYDTLVRSWASAIGKVHPEDAMPIALDEDILKEIIYED